MDLIATLRQPEGIGTGGGAHVENGGRRGRQIPKHDLLRARELQLRGTRCEASFLRHFSIILGNFFGKHRLRWPFHPRIHP
jgi:hypothetical protein